MRIITEVVKNLSQIREDWERLLLESDTATVFQAPAWVNAWQNYFILGVYDEGKLVGVGVFEERDKKIIFGAMHGLADFGDIVAQRGREQEVWQQILKHLRMTYNVSSIMLDFVREESPSFEVLSKLGKIRLQEVAPQIDVPRSWENYLLSLGRKKRHELKRKMRQVKGEIMVIEKISDKDADRFIELVKGSSEEKRRFMDPEMEIFFRKIVKLGKLFALGDMAMVLGFEWKNNWYLYNSGYMGSGVGIALFGMIIEQAIKSKIERVDFLRGNERYKYDLGAVDKKLYNMEV